MKKILSFLLALTMLLGVTSALADDEQVVIEFVNWGSAEANTSAAFHAMIDAFEAKYPNIKVELTEYAYNSVADQLVVRSAGGTAPDVAQVSPFWVAALAEMDALLPINEILSEETMNDFYPSALGGTTIDGNVYSAPWIINAICMFYNKTLMAEAGITEVPATWDELIADFSEAIAKLGTNEDGNRIYGRTISSKMLYGAGYFFLPDVWAYGGDVVDADGNVVFNSEGTVAAFTEAQKLFEEGVVASGLEIKENRTLFALGQVGFHFDAGGQVSTFTTTSPRGEGFADEFGVALIPSDTFSSDHHLVAFKDTEHPEEVAKFIDFMTGPEAIQIYLDNGQVIFPARESSSAIEYYSTLSEKMQPFLEATKICHSLPIQSVNFIPAMEEIVDGIQRVCINFEDPATVVADVDAQLQELLGK